MQLIDLFKKYPSKGKLPFLKIYESYFKNFKNRKINILEIGVNEGKSLMIWKDYFPKAVFNTIAKVGHWLHAEKPQEFFELTRNFLKK